MKEKKENYVRYVVITSLYYWGSAKSLKEALENANVNSIYAFNSKKEGTNKAIVYRVELDPIKSAYNEKSAKALEEYGVCLDEDYREGDLIEPWVNDWGNLQSWGAKSSEKVIELKIK